MRVGTPKTKGKAEKKKAKSGWRELGKPGDLFYVNCGKNPVQVN